jgi:pyruvate dehydrogenase E2 component (dihydrolipoyllysine-residue acetyltransferase)
MSVEFRMPDIGEGIAEVELLEWHVEVGSQVREYDVLATIQTDKSIVEMSSPFTGTVVRLGAAPGDILPVGDVLVVLDTGTDTNAGTGTNAGADAGDAAEMGTGAAPAAEPVAERPRAAPAVRRLAVELGVSLADVRGSGPSGRITNEDVRLAAAAGADQAGARPGPPQDEDAGEAEAKPAVGPVPDLAAQQGAAITRHLPDEHVPLRGLRRQIAKNMAESWRTIPHITDWREADATQLIEARRALSAHVPAVAGALTYVPFFVKITATALRHHPLLNASFDEEHQEYVLHRRINIGIATSVPDGLLVPVVRDADTKTVIELAEEIAELVGLARERKASREQLTGGTYTVNNFGAIGGHLGTPIIRPPEVGILGFGRISDRVVAVDGAPAVRSTIGLSSVGDHRLHDGDTLAAFTSAVMDLIERPYALLGELR